MKFIKTWRVTLTSSDIFRVQISSGKKVKCILMRGWKLDKASFSMQCRVSKTRPAYQSSHSHFAYFLYKITTLCWVSNKTIRLITFYIVCVFWYVSKWYIHLLVHAFKHNLLTKLWLNKNSYSFIFVLGLNFTWCIDILEKIILI